MSQWQKAGGTGHLIPEVPGYGKQDEQVLPLLFPLWPPQPQWDTCCISYPTAPESPTPTQLWGHTQLWGTGFTPSCHKCAIITN